VGWSSKWLTRRKPQRLKRLLPRHPPPKLRLLKRLLLRLRLLTLRLSKSRLSKSRRLPRLLLPKNQRL
jgi:hypothetical protein